MDTSWRREEGNALILSVMILLALTTVGLISVQRTNTDLMVAGNIVRSGQTQLACEAGLHHTVGDLRKRLLQVVGVFENTGDTRMKLDAFSTALSEGQALPSLVPEDPSDQAVARTIQGMAYQTDIIGAGEIRDMAGYEVDKICFRVFDIDTYGGIPTVDGQSMEDTLQKGVSSRCRARVVVGPTQCGVR